MKKAIAILLVLLVAGVMFGAYTPAVAPADATLKLSASNNGVLQQKITAAVVTDGSGWNSATAVTDPQAVDLSVTTAQNVAYYSMRTNTKKSVDVTVTATPMANGTLYYIPYTLGVGEKSGGFTGSAGTEAPTFTSDIELVTDGKYTGMTYLSEQISVTFASDYTQTALEGDYASTITFAITAD